MEVEGDYLASPLPIRPAGSMSSGAVDRLAERFSFVAHESGVGLLDPRMIEYASRFPEVLPSPSLRRVFASERLVVLDGASLEVPGIGILEVPAIAVAVPLATTSAPALQYAAIPVFELIYHPDTLSSDRSKASQSVPSGVFDTAAFSSFSSISGASAAIGDLSLVTFL